MTDHDEDRPRFSTILAGHAGGGLDAEASMELAKLVEAVAIHQKAGTISVDITVEPQGGGRTVTLAGAVKVKAPKPAPEVSVHFVGQFGSLHRDDPYTERLDGVEVPGTARTTEPGRTIPTE